MLDVAERSRDRKGKPMTNPDGQDFPTTEDLPLCRHLHPRTPTARPSAGEVHRDASPGRNHFLETFWGWKGQQLADRMAIWTLPDRDVELVQQGRILAFERRALAYAA